MSERLIDDLAHVARKRTLSRDLLECSTHRGLSISSELAPTIERTGNARGDGRIDLVERQHLIDPERITAGVAPVKLGFVERAEPYVEPQRLSPAAPSLPAQAWTGRRGAASRNAAACKAKIGAHSSFTSG